MTTLRRRPRWVLAIAAVPLAVIGALAACQPEGGSPPATSTTTTTTTPLPPVLAHAVIVGDSMTLEARRDLATQGPRHGIALTVRGKGKAAPCDQLPTVLSELAKRPDLLAVQWSGNGRFSNRCTQAFEVTEIVAEYRAALVRIAAARPTGTTVVLVGTPPMNTIPWSLTRTPLNDLYRSFADTDPGFRYMDPSRSLAPDGRYTRTLPCTTSDHKAKACGRWGAPSGRVVVRDNLGLHFCPVAVTNENDGCPVWSSGSLRYARSISQGLAAIVR